MGIFNLLDPLIPFLGETFDVSLNWLGKLIQKLIEGIGVVGIGIIVFSVILRLVVLPFDIYQRVAMRKQNIKMRENQDKLEKLQKQYANDKQMYNQKMMEMYKENGISMFSSCLPAIISLIVFIVAINAFNAFSYYSNLGNYNTMVEAYNGYLAQYTTSAEEILPDYVSVQTDENGAPSSIRVYDDSENKFIYFVVSIYNENYAENNFEYLRAAEKTYYIDAQKVYLNADYNAEIERIYNEYNQAEEDAEKHITKEEACRMFFQGKAQDKVAETYRTVVRDRMSFLWIKNIWETDASYKHPVLSYSNFSSSVSRSKLSVDGVGKIKFSEIGRYTNAYTADNYAVVTGKLTEQKSAPNGYYILIVLSIGTILLQQFVSMRSQKEQNKYSSVDGQGAANQKMMLVVMTVMFAIFAFMYSAAFSIYMITSNILSLVMTLAVNKVVEIVMTKKEEKALQEKYNKRFPGRTYQATEKGKKGKEKNGKK